MKYNILLWLVAAIIALGIFACEKEYVAPANTNFSDAAVSSSGTKTLERGDTTSFADLSKGVLNRTWTVPADSAKIVNLDGRDPSELEIAHVQFDLPGLYKIGLKVEFEDSKLNLDTFFNVTVFDFVQTEIDIVDIQSSFFEQKATQIDMYEGGTITFADSSAGNPNRRLWKFQGGSPEEAGGISVDNDKEFVSVDVTYPEIGTYDVQLITWRQFPEGEPDTVLLEDYVNVVENIDPPSILGIEENGDGVIQVLYNLSMKATGDLTPNFALMVDDTLTAIANIEIDSDNDRVLNVTPAVNLSHRTNSTELSYDGNGGLTRLNDIPAEAFSQSIAIYQPPNLLEMAGFDPTFESGDLSGWNPELVQLNGNNSGASFEWASEGFDGSNGALLVNINQFEDIGEGEKNNFRITTLFEEYGLNFEEGKTYRFEFMYKVEGGNVAEMTSRVHEGGGWGPAPGGGWTSGNDTDWKFRQINWGAAMPNDFTNGRLSIQFIGKSNNTASRVLFDNMHIYAVEDL